MYCGECGTKNAKNAKFCESCGAQLVEEKEVKKEVTSKKKDENKKPISQNLKEMPKKNKIILLVVVAVLAILVIAYALIGKELKPTAIAEDYFLAAVRQDAEKLYQYLDVEKSEFTTKDMFVKIMETDEEEVKLTNYTVGKAQKDATGLSTTVTITYVLDGSKDSQTMDIVLVKQKNKKYGIFDNWKVSVDGEATVDEFKIKVLKDSKLTLEGIEVDTKYIDKDSSNETYDVYKMPAMFKQKYSATITLPYGFDVEDEIRVTSYSSYTYSFSKDTLPDKVQEDIKNTIKTGLQTLYDGAKDKKSFDDIKKTFEYQGADLTKIEETYNNLVSSLDGDGLTSITFKDVTLTSFRSSDDETLYAYVKASYDYTLSYDDNGETKTHSSSANDYVYVYFTYKDGAFRITNVSSLNTYFSKYY